MKKKQVYDILIIGLGPVGMIAANLLGKYGLKVAIFERNEQLYDLPRAIHIDDETMRIIQLAGLHRDTLKICKSVPGMQLIDRHKKVLLETSKAATSGFEASYLFYQPDLEAILVKGLERFPEVAVFWGAEVTEVQHNAELAEVTVLQNKDAQTYQGKYALVCDGANSTIRDLLGLPLKDLKFSRQNLKTDVVFKEPEELPHWIQKTCEPKRQSYVFLNSFDNHVRWEFSLPKNTKYDQAHWEHPDTIRQLLSLVTDPDKVVQKHIVVYKFATKIATQWQQGTFFLAGDAAHQMPPYIGQGICAGFRDVFNLAWKLTLVLKHQVNPSILASYPKERIPHVRFVMFITRWVGRLFISRWTLAIKALAKVTPQKWRKVQVPPQKLKRGLFGKNRRLRGHIFPQHEINYLDIGCQLDDSLSDGFNIIGFTHSPSDYLSAENLKYLENLNTYFYKIVTSNTEPYTDVPWIHDYQQHYQKWFGKHRVDFVIVRPDRYIYDAVKITELDKAVQRMKEHFAQI